MTFVLALLAWLAVAIVIGLAAVRALDEARDDEDLAAIRRFERGQDVLRPPGWQR